MAEPVTELAVWHEDEVSLARVIAVLDELRRPEPMPPTRTSVLTLVIVGWRIASAERAHAALRELGGRHPARVLSLITDRDATPPGFNAEVQLLGGEAGGHEVWFEDVRLSVRGPAVDHLDSLIEPFTVADLPVVVWFVDGLPEPDDPLLRAADILLVDARDFGDAACFETLAALRSQLPLVDLSWQRLRPWRELLASLFEGSETRPFLGDIRSVRVEGRAGPRELLAGWISAQLAVPTAEVHLVDAAHVSIEVIAADPAGNVGLFAVTRQGDDRAVRAIADLADGPTAEVTVPLPDPTPGWGLAAALARLERDPVYEAALDAALRLVGRLA